MKNLIKVFMFSIGILLVSCTDYTHKKVVKNSTRFPVEVVVGCCGNENRFTIDPDQSEVIFTCIYQQSNRPSAAELNWNVKLLKHGGVEVDLSNYNLWKDNSNGNNVEFEYEVK